MNYTALHPELLPPIITDRLCLLSAGRAAASGMASTIRRATGLDAEVMSVELVGGERVMHNCVLVSGSILDLEHGGISVTYTSSQAGAVQSASSFAVLR